MQDKKGRGAHDIWPVTADTIREIEGYQWELPELYDPVKLDLDVLKEMMWQVVEKLNREGVPGR